jgi:hypothetical protein
LTRGCDYARLYSGVGNTNGLGKAIQVSKETLVMMRFSIESSDSSVEFEMPETITFKSIGIEHVIDMRRITVEGWKKYIDYCKRYATDGAPKKPEKVAVSKLPQEWIDKRTEAVEIKISRLYGERPIKAGRTADPVAQWFKAILTKHLTKNVGMKLSEVPSLGTTVDEATAVAKGLKVSKAITGKILEIAEAEAAKQADALDSLKDLV